MTVFDYIVVGAGIEGSSTAYYLSKNGHKTLLLEQFSLGHVRGSSHGGSRITRKIYNKPIYTQMTIEGERMWLDLERESGKQFYLKTGMLFMAPEDKKVIPEYKTVADFYQLPNTVLKGQRLYERFPGLRNIPETWEALFEPEAGVLLADKCLQAYHDLFKKYGGIIKDNEKVIKILPKSNSVEILTDTYGQYSCKKIVLCLGAWSGKFVKTHLGLKLPLQPISISVCYWKELKFGAYAAANGFPAVFLLADDEKEYFLLPSLEIPGQVKISYNHGPTVDPDTREGLSLEEAVDKISKFLTRYLPDVDSTKPVSVQSCLYTFTPDMHLILDYHPIYRNVIIGAGFSGHGFKLAPVVGRILGTLATQSDGESSNIGYDLSDVSITRFTDGKAVKTRHML